jgi:hypothetical protein
MGKGQQIKLLERLEQMNKLRPRFPLRSTIFSNPGTEMQNAKIYFIASVKEWHRPAFEEMALSYGGGAHGIL